MNLLKLLFIFIVLLLTFRISYGEYEKNEKIFMDKPEVLSLSYQFTIGNGKSLKVKLSKKILYHYEILDILISPDFNCTEKDLYISVFNNGHIEKSANLIKKIPVLKIKDKLKAVFMPSWNSPVGKYIIKLFYKGRLIDINQEISFFLRRRVVRSIDIPLSIADLEMNKNVNKVNIKGITREATGSEAVIDWINFIRADMIWILSGETTSFTKRVALDNMPYWDRGPIENLNSIKIIAKKNGIKVGAYIISFFVPGNNGVPGRYKPGVGYNKSSDNIYKSRHISLGCKRRIDDIVEMVKKFQNDDYIDYIGFDFIRTGRADGYELVEDFTYETNIKRPSYWKKLSLVDKIKWLAKKIEVERDVVVIEKWRWWRAHKVAVIVKQIIEKANVTKPVWVFTLGWEHGSEHGQDPVMFFDAGVTIDAVMLYEASNYQFEKMMKQWKQYMSLSEGNLVIGNCVDYKLLDSELLSPPEELYRRNIEGYCNIYKDGMARGIFFHDIARAVWGRRGGYEGWRYGIRFFMSVFNLKNGLRKGDILTDILFLPSRTIYVKKLFQT